MAVIGRIFKTIQIINKPVSVPDHDFSKTAKHKLVLSIYLLINSSNTNNLLYFDKMQIFICPEYFLSISYKTILEPEIRVMLKWLK
jgi:hypothetical protein